LGTVQLGLPYGVANQTGKPDHAEAARILTAAWDGGIRTFDTAQGYGESEAIIGRFLATRNDRSKAQVVTKLDPRADYGDAGAVRDSVATSASALNVDRLYGLLLHHEKQLEGWEFGVGRALRSCVTDGVVEHLGVSVYTCHGALRALQADGIEIVQVPSNVLDRRFEEAGVFDVAQDLGKTIFVRSVYLQGLLLLEPKDLPRSMGFAEETVELLACLAKQAEVSPAELALWYARKAYPDARILFGAETCEQVLSNLDAEQVSLPDEFIDRVRGLFANVDEKVLNPSLWPEKAIR